MSKNISVDKRFKQYQLTRSVSHLSYQCTELWYNLLCIGWKYISYYLINKNNILLMYAYRSRSNNLLFNIKSNIVYIGIGDTFEYTKFSTLKLKILISSICHCKIGFLPYRISSIMQKWWPSFTKIDVSL